MKENQLGQKGEELKQSLKGTTNKEVLEISSTGYGLESVTTEKKEENNNSSCGGL
ncbi:hypothetical protein KHA94_11560 [Bacillus sp. FJAT-49705]|uniref:Uncharacterized protein n=1 Tax=Cytobacillus citreus TaxID=2833586 RepID=A0ABS5NSM1_9BACI|nr:hypothetical protein [Cytobacillus citreus]MBS4190820.1 hypothetical protein [Cytobacillus citreus]